jgi:hypothetical protein
MNKIFRIALNAIPVLLMIGLIPIVANDYILTLLYGVIIVAALMVWRSPNDLLIFAFGFVVMIVSEYLFISTGVETFNRTTLLGIMPLWLPFLWGYGFVAIRRSIVILG